jgi:hypothetical protein
LVDKPSDRDFRQHFLDRSQPKLRRTRHRDLLLPIRRSGGSGERRSASVHYNHPRERHEFRLFFEALGEVGVRHLRRRSSGSRIASRVDAVSQSQC